MECKAKALEYVCSLLDGAFQCVIPVEHAGCTLAVTKDGKSFLPLDVKSARVSSNRKYFAYNIRYRKESAITILAGFNPGMTQPFIWHIDLNEMETIKQLSKRMIFVSIGAKSDSTRRVNNLEQLIEYYWSQDSLLVPYEKIMQKIGEENSTQIRNGKSGEMYLKVLLEQMGYEVKFPMRSGLTTDFVLSGNTIGDIELRVQVKYSSDNRSSYGNNVFRVEMSRNSSIRKHFTSSDCDIFMVCLQDNHCDNIEHVYCFPTSALVKAGVVKSQSHDSKGKYAFYLKPNANAQSRKSKYLKLNIHKFDMKDYNGENGKQFSALFGHWINIAAIEKAAMTVNN